MVSGHHSSMDPVQQAVEKENLQGRESVITQHHPMEAGTALDLILRPYLVRDFHLVQVSDNLNERFKLKNY